MPFAAQVRRVAVGVVPDDEREVGYFTFRPQPDGSMVEDRPVRDVHPMVGRRLNLWRLRDFDLTRLDAPEDVLLLHAVATGHPQDQRLVALANSLGGPDNITVIAARVRGQGVAAAGHATMPALQQKKSL